MQMDQRPVTDGGNGEVRGPSRVDVQLDLTERLKLATQAVHEEVENGSRFNRIVAEKKFLKDELSKERGVLAEAEWRGISIVREQYRHVYVAFLVASLGFEGSVHQALQQYDTELRDRNFPFEGISTPELIVRDLDRFPESRGWDREALPPLRLPAITSITELVGLIYVQRGSRNGNAVIAKAVYNVLGITPEEGGAFLLGGGDMSQTRRRWGTVKDWINAVGREVGPQGQEEILATAEGVFRSLLPFHQAVDKELMRVMKVDR